MLAHILVALIFVLTAAHTQVYAATPSVIDENPLESCVSQINELKTNSLVEDVLSSFGGLNTLVGQYKMRGLIGALSNTKVEFKIDDEKFWVSVNGDKLKQIHLCRDQQGVAAKATNILKLKVLKPKTPQNGLILVRPGSDKDQLLVSAHRSKWKFMKFKKTSVDVKLTASVQN